jgi:uncharacterized protein (DUF342 family)
MDESTTSSGYGFRIEISADRMTATLLLEQGAEVSAVTVINKLRDMKIANFDDGIVIEVLEKRKTEALSKVVAEGVPAVDDKPERVEYRVPVADGRACISNKVTTGQIIAIVTPEVPGTDGKDVFGEIVERKKNPLPLQVGRNLLQGKGKVISELNGNLRLSGNLLSVEPLLEVRGDDGNMAPVNFDGDSAIKGSLNEGRSLQITGSLTVGGAVEAVQLKVGGSVHIQGGIIGKQKGRYIVGGDLRCRFISGGFIVSGRDVMVQSDITDSRIACGGKLSVAQGVIFGGALSANSGLSCITLGHPGGTPTLIEAGAGIVSRSISISATSQIELNQKRIHIVRSTIDPLLKMMKTLTPQQREKVTELLYEADELDLATKKLIADLEQQLRDLSGRASAQICVEKVIHAGVTVRFPTVKTVFVSSIKGPLILEPHTAGGVTEIFLIDQTGQSRTLLPSIPVHASVGSSAEAARPAVPLAKAA